MPAAEKKLLSKVQDHLQYVFAAVCFLAGVGIRISLGNVASADYVWFLEPWYEQIKESGITEQVGNYNLLYQLVIFIFTRAGAAPMPAYKLFSAVFDFLLSLTAGHIVRNVADAEKEWKGILAFAAVWLSPMVFTNSAAWAQCDAIYTFWAVLALYCAQRERYPASFILLGISFAFKLQAVFFLPIFVFIYFVRKKFSVACFALVPAAMIGASLPAMVMGGRNLSEVFRIYMQQTDAYQRMANNYPSVWLLLCDAGSAEQYQYFKPIAIMMTILVLGLLVIRFIRKGYRLKDRNLYYIALLMTYTCVLFLPSMHERYSFPYEILAIVVAVLLPRTVPLCVGLLCISMRTYGSFLFAVPINMTYLVYANLVIYGLYAAILFRELDAEKRNEK